MTALAPMGDCGRIARKRRQQESWRRVCFVMDQAFAPASITPDRNDPHS